jgi:prepilin-type N-terminal cleavage/methylation domain-containing protein
MEWEMGLSDSEKTTMFYNSMKRSSRFPFNHRGFTLFEMVTVLILISIFAIVVTTATVYLSINSDLPNQTEILKSSLRFAQIRALNDAGDSDKWGVHLNSTSYTYYRNGEVAYYYDKNGNKVIDNLPGECGSIPLICIKSANHTLPSGMTITTGAGTTVSFDKWGRPVDNGGNPLTTNINIVLSSGSGSSTFTITKNTGFIP